MIDVIQEIKSAIEQEMARRASALNSSAEAKEITGELGRLRKLYPLQVQAAIACLDNCDREVSRAAADFSTSSQLAPSEVRQWMLKALSLMFTDKATATAKLSGVTSDAEAAAMGAAGEA